jgi:hypothetical protein
MNVEWRESVTTSPADKKRRLERAAGKIRTYQTSDDAEHNRANEGDGEVGRNDAQFDGEGHRSLPDSFRSTQ